MNSQEPKWPPDWRDPALYVPNGRTMLEWRWEFLRRRLDYQRAFAECDRRFSETVEAYSELFQRYRDGGPKESWDAGEELERLSGNAERAGEFGLSGMLNPAKTYDHDTLSTYFERPDWGGVLDLKEGDVAKHYERGVIIVAFDLRYDIGEQLGDTRQMLEDERRNLDIAPGVQRKHPERWSKYLRILDARNAQATFAQIGQEILGLTEASYDEQAAAGKQQHTDACNLQAKLTS